MLLWVFLLIGGNGENNSGNSQTVTEPPATTGVVGNPSEIMDEVETANEITIGTVADGLVGIFTYFERLKIVIIGGVFQFLGTVVGESAGSANSGTVTVITPEDILFNRLAITDINFFNMTSFGTGDNQQSLSGSNNPIKSLKESVASWYMTLRTMAIIILLCVLIYIGIRMVMASNPESKVNYKKMLVNWVVSLAMVFLLHYIILITINVNNVLVDMISSVKDNALPESNSVFFGNYIRALVTQSFYPLATISWSSAIVYLCIVALTFIFLIMYIKRMITVAFLILISPIITITYSIDKAGNGKAEAFSTWLREFLHNVLIQPFHCLIYVAFVAIAMNALQGEGTLASAVLVIVTMFFILQAEDLVKKIFGIDSKSTGSALATAAVLSAAYGKLKPSGGKKAPSNVGKAPVATNAGTRGQTSSLVASNNIAASNVQESGNTNSLSSEELSRKLSGGAGEDIDYRNMRSFEQDARKRAEQERIEAERRKYAEAMASDYNATMSGENVKVNTQAGATTNDSMTSNAANKTEASTTSSDIPYVEMPEVYNTNSSNLKRLSNDATNLVKGAAKGFVKGNMATSGIAGAAIGGSLAGLGGADIGNAIGSMAVGKKIQEYIEDNSGYTQKINKLEEYIKESNIKNNERTLATAFSNHKHGAEYNKDADIQQAREYLSMNSNKINDIKEPSERQYVQSLHAMRSIYNQNYDEDPNEKVIETMGKIIDKDIKPND